MSEQEKVELSGLGKAEKLVKLYCDAQRGEPIFGADAWDRYEEHLASVCADLDAPIRWRPISEHDRSPEPVIGYREGALPCVRVMMFDDGAFVDTFGNIFCPTHFAELKDPDHG